MMNNWKVSSLGEIADIKRGLPSQDLNYVDSIEEGVRLIRINDFKSDNPKYIKETEKTQKLTIKKGDVIIAGTGATAGISFLVEDLWDGLPFSYNAPRIRLKEGNNSQFIYYILNSEKIKKQQNTLFTGNAQPFLDTRAIASFKIPVPPLPEQQKIAAILSTVDAKIEIIDQQITETQDLKKGLMQRLLTKGIGHKAFKDSALGEIPESWEVVKIQDLLDNGNIISHLDGNHGGLYPKANEFIDEGVPYIGANCFLNNSVDFSKCKHLSMERSLKFRKGVAKNGDVLFAHNATVGPVAYLETELDFVILSTTATYFRLDNKTIDAKYWLFFLSSPIFKNQYEKVMGQSTRNQVPITMQRSFHTVLPSFEEQKEISEIINTSDEKLKVLIDKKATYQELKKGLMQQLLTGLVRVKV